MSLRWLHVVPEFFVMVAALPALLATLWFVFLAWLTRPGGEERARIADLADHLDDMDAEVLKKDEGAGRAPGDEHNGG
jgi:hypothetical protein